MLAILGWILLGFVAGVVVTIRLISWTAKAWNEEWA